MKEKLKSSSKTLYGVCTCIIVLMVACYFGNNSVKGTYSVTTCYACVNGSATIYATSSIPGLTCTVTEPAKCSSSSSSYCSNKGYYDSKSKCETATNRKCKEVNNTAYSGCYVSTDVGLSCVAPADTQANCQSSGYKCTQDVTTGCWFVTGTSICTTGTYYSGGQQECQNTTGYVCSQGTGNGGCWKKTSTLLGGGVDCSTGNFKGTCGSKTIEICGTGGSFSCVLGTSKQKYSYTCTHDSGSQTGPDGSYSTCTLNSLINDPKCYICLGSTGSVSSGGSYKWLTTPGSNCHVATPSTEATCTGTPSPKKYQCTLTDNSKVCVTAYDSAWAGASVGETGTACKEVTSCGGSGGTTPSNPSSSSTPSSSSSTPSTTPSSVPSSTPSSSSNIEDNPKTGSVAIFIVWIIALGTLVYAGVYFKQVREDN